MRIEIKVLWVTMIVAVASVARSELVFEQSELELHPAVGNATAVGHFKYQNKGDQTIAIKSVTTSCGCTAASAKQSAEPGEKGEVTATFTVGDRIGTQQKMITVVTDDPAHPSTALNLKVVIPRLLELQPTFLYWQAGEAAKAKTIVAKAGDEVSIKNLEVSSSSSEFTTRVESQPSGKEFRISVKPRQTTNAASATLTIKPNLPNGKSNVLYATASVTRPPSTSPQPVAATTLSPGNQPSPAATAANVESSKGKIDACALLTSKEIESVQGEPLKDTKRSGGFGAGFAASQCYFGLPTSANSISLTVTQRGDGSDARDPQQFWKETFHGEKDQEKARNDEEEKTAPPQKIDGLGDEAFWTGNRVGGALYVLKKDIFIRISVGGPDNEETKINKSKALAQKALERL